MVDDDVALQPPNKAVERTAGSHALAAAAHRRRSPHRDWKAERRHKRTFALEHVPTTRSFSSTSRSFEGCTITYSTASIYLNKLLLAEIDFRKFRKEEARSVILAIPPKTL